MTFRDLLLKLIDQNRSLLDILTNILGGKKEGTKNLIKDLAEKLEGEDIFGNKYDPIQQLLDKSFAGGGSTRVVGED